MAQHYGRQTCLNGHVITHYLGAGFETTQPFCGLCGEPTITDCPNCKVPQRGADVDGMGLRARNADAYCWNCGKPFPWAERHLSAAQAMVNEEEQLTDEDKAVLTAALTDLTSDTPQTTLAATRYKRIVAKAGIGLGEALQKTLVDVLSETAKKIILGN